MAETRAVRAGDELLAGSRGKVVLSARAQHERKRRKRWRPGSRRAVLLLLGPFGAVFIIVYMIPLVYAIKESVFGREANGLGLGVAKSGFVGLKNFAFVLRSGTWWRGMARVAEFGLVQIPVMLIGAIVIALILDVDRIKLRKLFRASIFMPYAIPGVIAGLMWAFIYLPSLSPVQSWVHALPGLENLNLLGHGVVLWTIANASTWEFVGFNMLIITSGLQAIPHELYEAARLEGAGEIRLITGIKLPLVAPAIGLTAVFSLIGTVQLFNEPTVFRSITTAVTGTYTPNMYAYSQALSVGNLNTAAAASLVLAAIGAVLSFGVVGFLSRKGLTG